MGKAKVILGLAVLALAVAVGWQIGSREFCRISALAQTILGYPAGSLPVELQSAVLR
jgi:hypothetical protein